MNPRAAILAIVAGLAVLFVSDGLIHGVGLKGIYDMTPELWRPEEEMILWAMCLGQLLFPAIFLTLWLRYRKSPCPKGASCFGFALSLFFIPHQLVMYAVIPYPEMLVVWWVLASCVQMTALGFVSAAVYVKVAGEKIEGGTAP